MRSAKSNELVQLFVKGLSRHYNGMIMSDSFHIKGLNGSKTLTGTIAVNGAKNAVLPAIASALLFKDELAFENVPAIEDVHHMQELLTALGAVSALDSPRRYRVDAKYVSRGALDPVISEKMRASIILTGPLLARFGSVSFPHPGGCVIGPRPIDLFLEGFEKMGAGVSYDGGQYHISALRGKLSGADIFFPLISVTGTETLMMAATLAEGTTTLRNAALEPEIAHLAQFLNAHGAHIEGAGTPTIHIQGGELLRAEGAVYRTIPDRIETGSFLLLGALAADELIITDCDPSHTAILIDLLRRSGVPIETGEAWIRIRGNGRLPNDSLRAFSVRTHEYPGFPTDLQAPMTVYLTQVAGEGIVFETIFEGRLNYTADLIKMGADITVFDPHRVLVKGPTPLFGRELEGPDIRAGLAFIIAGIVAEGESIIHNAYYVDRGYERIEERLRGLGVSIERVHTS